MNTNNLPCVTYIFPVLDSIAQQQKYMHLIQSFINSRIIKSNPLILPNCYLKKQFLFILDLYL